MMKLSKKFILALGLVLVVKSLFAIEIENLNNNSNIDYLPIQKEQ